MRLNAQVLFLHKRLTCDIAEGDDTSAIAWTWPVESAEAHLDWLLERFLAIGGPESLMRDLSTWRTRDLDTHAPLVFHGCITGINVALPHHGARATLTLTLQPLP